jgi:hypothetical protein
MSKHEERGKQTCQRQRAVPSGETNGEETERRAWGASARRESEAGSREREGREAEREESGEVAVAAMLRPAGELLLVPVPLVVYLIRADEQNASKADGYILTPSTQHHGFN